MMRQPQEPEREGEMLVTSESLSCAARCAAAQNLRENVGVPTQL